MRPVKTFFTIVTLGPLFVFFQQAKAQNHPAKIFPVQFADTSTGYLPGSFTPSKLTKPSFSQSASPYVLLHTGARELDHNGNWKRHIVNVPSGNIHMTFGIFDSIPGRNNVYVYQCYNPLTGALSFPIGSEPTAPFGWSLQNGGVDVTPSGRAVIAGRSTLGSVSNKGSAVVFDAGSCLGQLSADTAAIGSSLPLDPDIHIINESTWVVPVAPFNLLHMSSVRTTDGGATWSAEVPMIQSSYMQFAIAGNRDSDGDPNNDTVWVAATGCQDSGCFADYEEILVSRSTDGGQSWMIPSISASGVFEYPVYHILHSGGIDAMMVNDTFHVVWLDRVDDYSTIPGGHIHHLAVTPNFSVIGTEKVADINLPLKYCNYPWQCPYYRLTDWAHPTLSYRPSPSPVLYCLWSQPPDNGNGGYADSTRSTSRTYPINDIFCAASRNNGRSWDAPRNVTQTNNPGCLGPLANPPSPCQHELYVSAAERADSIIWVLSNMETLPGFQASTTADQGFPGVSLSTYLNVIMQDQWRLYKVLAYDVPVTCATAIKGDLNEDGLLTPTDIVDVTNCVFLGNFPTLGDCACDTNCDGLSTSTDVVIEILAVFLNHAFPCQ